MNIEDINLGDPPTGAGGDTIRDAFGKTNQNFGAAKQALEGEVQAREQLLATQRDQLIALIESVNGPLPNLRADFKARSFGFKNESGFFLPCEYNDLFALSAPSPKWVWNAQRQLVEVPAGQPAWDHDPVTGQSLGQRIGSLDTTYCTTDIENNAFAKYGDVTPVTHAKFPEGGLYEISHNPASHPTLTGAGVRVNGGVRLDSPDIRYAIVNPGDFDQIRLTVYAFEDSVTCSFNFNDMTTSNRNAPPRAYADVFKSLGDGFYLVAITTPGDTNTYTRFCVGGFHSDGTPTVEGESFFMALPQVLAGDTTSSFIYNPGSTNLLREADVPVFENVDVSKWFDQSEGTIFYQGTRGAGSPDWLFQFSDSNGQTRIFMRDANESIQAILDPGGAASTLISAFPNDYRQGAFKAALSWKDGQYFRFAVNGQFIGEATPSSLENTITDGFVGCRETGEFQNGKYIEEFLVEKRGRTAAELQELTS